MSIYLSGILTNDEIKAVTNLVKAHIAFQEAKIALDLANEQYKQAAQELSTEYLRQDKDEAGEVHYVSSLPETLVIQVRDNPYLVEIDPDGDHGHRVKMIGGII